jgi:hypothetical protein
VTYPSCRKNGDVPKSSFAQLAAVVPSAGTISHLFCDGLQAFARRNLLDRDFELSKMPFSRNEQGL